MAQPGFEIVHASLRAPMPWRKGFAGVQRFFESRDRPMSALCAIELRSADVQSFDGFAEFNAQYQGALADYGLMVDGRNPVARTNVVPEPGPPVEVVMHAFSFTIQSPTAQPTFVTAGAGELVADALDEEAIVARGDTSPDGMRTKATHVMTTMSARLQRLGLGWRNVTTTDIYMVGNPGDVVGAVVRPQPGTATRGIHWYPSRPPVAGLDFEMDVRGVNRELVVSLGDA